LLEAVRKAIRDAAVDCTPADAARKAAKLKLVVAFSGGPDSTVLLDLVSRVQRERGSTLGAALAVHVHHGLQESADAWVVHCEEQCRLRDVPLTVCRVRPERKRGIEAGARDARYAALVQAAQSHGAQAVLTAHHADDRIETFLLQWLRGAGPAGLAGIAAQRTSMLAGVRIVRPLLEVTRADIEDYVRRHGLATVSDPSNADPRFARNALRTQVLPRLARIRAGFRKSAARSIELVGEAAELLEQIARESLEHCLHDAPPGMLRLDSLATFEPARQALVLRAWLELHGIEAPPRARVREALEQALGQTPAGRNSRMLIRFGSRELRRHRGLLCLRTANELERTSEQIRWQGESRLAVPSWGGVLRFVQGDQVGFDPEWLQAAPLELRARTGGERFKPHPTRPSKRLKHLFQEAGVPEFERGALPMVWRAGRLIFVPGLGEDARLTERGRGQVRIEWQGAASLTL
jgi:tRNA(Ile)-lysidine synthase